jgi:L-fuculose-phosphate aldolase
MVPKCSKTFKNGSPDSKYRANHKKSGDRMGSASLPGLNSVGSIDRSMVEKIVRQIALEYFRKGNSEADAADASGEFPSDPISGQLSGNCASALNRPAPNPKLFFTPEAEEIKKEICAVGRKLWLRQYVDGNGGNISHRIGPNDVICTPTMVSKYDLTPEVLSLVDLDGNQIEGTHPRTSEILLHLEIYKEVPEAKSVVHCHPPHATAYAITGRVPPNLILPEFEVFVGKVAIAPYETPGSVEFAQTVVPYVKQHNTVLLANHGIVCWGDTVTHAEWLAEVLETYCWTVMLAAQLGVPISQLSQQQGSDLLAFKKRLPMPLPDVRFNASKMQESPEADLEAVVKSVTDAVMGTIAGK